MTRNHDASLSSRRQVIVSVAAAVTVAAAAGVRASPTAGITHTAEAIHQKVTFKASRHRVYTLLTDPQQFQKVVALSGAVQSGKVKANIPAQIGSGARAPFSIFGAFISGLNIELVPDARLVQAWRPGYWPAGIFSIVKFDLADHDGETVLTFDHTGFPAGDAGSLAQGWKQNYWEPMAKVLAQ